MIPIEKKKLGNEYLKLMDRVREEKLLINYIIYEGQFYKIAYSQKKNNRASILREKVPL